MRISLLEKREDFYTILIKTLDEWDYIDRLQDNPTEIYYVNKYLNFIAHPSLGVEVFNVLAKEYGTSIKFWKRFFQKQYVKLAISHYFRPLMAHKKIKLSKKYQNFLILGGNHRLRLFNSDLNSSYVILKKGERIHFIKNEIKLKNRLRLSYAPALVNSGSNWFQEEYFEGTPLNRILDSSIKWTITDELIKVHSNELLIPTLEYLEPNIFLQQAGERIYSLIRTKDLKINTEIKKNIEDTVALLISKYSTSEPIPVSWTHGDFQTGNILVSNHLFKIIDWESTDRRFLFYDFFVLLGEIRSHGRIKNAFSVFENKIQKYNVHALLPPQWKLLLAMEELIFLINEDCSSNFFHPGEHVNEFCKNLVRILKHEENYFN